MAYNRGVKRLDNPSSNFKSVVSFSVVLAFTSSYNEAMIVADNGSSGHQSVLTRTVTVGKDFNVSPYIAAVATCTLVFGSWLLYCKVLLRYHSVSEKYLQSLPWAGSQRQWFSTLRTKVKSVTGLRLLLEDSYQKVGRQDSANRLKKHMGVMKLTFGCAV